MVAPPVMTTWSVAADAVPAASMTASSADSEATMAAERTAWGVDISTLLGRGLRSGSHPVGAHCKGYVRRSRTSVPQRAVALSRAAAHAEGRRHGDVAQPPTPEARRSHVLPPRPLTGLWSAGGRWWRPRGGGRRMRGWARRVAVRTLVVLASVTLVLALVAGYVRHAAVNSDQFANRATAALRDDSVRTLVARQVTDRVVLANAQDLLAARPLIESVVSGVVGGRAFTTAFRAGVRDVHRAVFDRDQQTVTLAVGDVGSILAAGLETLQPSIADRVQATRRVELVQQDIGSVGATAANVADTVRELAILLALAALACAAGALALSTDRRQTVVGLGVGAAAGGVVLVVAWSVLRAVAVDQVQTPDERAAVGGIYDAFLKDLRSAAWILAGCGAVVAAAAASVLRPVEIHAPLRRAAAWVTTVPQRPALRLVRGGAFVAAGLACLLERDAVLELAFTAAGLSLVSLGASAIRWVVREPVAAQRRHAPARRAALARARRPAIAVVVAGVLVVAGVSVFIGSGGTTTPAPAAGPCEGSVALCGRPLDQGALMATHNAMSGPLPGWFAAEQDRPIADQLRDGVRGLLIDTHYADRLANDRLRTDVGDVHKLRRLAEGDGLSPTTIDAALRTRERLGFEGQGVRGMYLCHTFCEIGGTPLAGVLRDLHHFPVAHPHEVVGVINQDYVTPQDFVGAVEDAGLGDLAYRGPTTGRWPTLRQMIDRNQRVVFLAENHAGAAPWYRLAYESIAEETPYTFKKT